MSESKGTKAPTKLSFLVLDSVDPHYNLAYERELLEVVEPGELIFMLWQNNDTIVIGQNQNPWKECAVEYFIKTGGTLARRLSGGGAVYHDMGNLNFSFVARVNCYNVPRQMNIICEAIRSFGLEAAVSGRNDLEINGRKFSGNAFFGTRDAHCQHGTLMMRVNPERLEKVLSPNKQKLQAKGVASVRARVQNLGDLVPGITTKALCSACKEAAENVLGLKAQDLEGRIDPGCVQKRAEHLGSWKWLFGKTGDFSHSIQQRFSWGSLELNLDVHKGVIEDARIFSDGMDADFIAGIAPHLKDVRFSSKALTDAIAKIPAEDEGQRLILIDLSALLQKLFENEN